MTKTIGETTIEFEWRTVASHCSRCNKPTAFIAWITYSTHNVNGEPIRVSSIRRYCREHGEKYSKRYGLEMK